MYMDFVAHLFVSTSCCSCTYISLRFRYSVLSRHIYAKEKERKSVCTLLAKGIGFVGGVLNK